MGNIEIVTSILSGIVIASSILTLLVHTGKISAISLKKKPLMVITETEPIMKVPRAKMKPEYSEKQNEVVASIVDRYSEFPLADIFKISMNREVIFGGLSDPDQYYWITAEGAREAAKRHGL